MPEQSSRGPFHGDLTFADGITREHLPSPLREAVARALNTPREVPPLQDPEGATVLPLARDDDGALRVPGDLRETREWTASLLPRPEALRALARVARTLHALHTRGLVHGDLRPSMIRVDARGAVGLLVPAHTPDVGALLRARLHPGGEDPACVGFAAPEVIAGTGCSPASDVYALAAIAYLTLAGVPPLGQVSLYPHAGTPDGSIANLLEAALHQSPTQRPTLERLAHELTRYADAVAAGAPSSVDPYRAPRPSPDATRPAELSPGLVFVLIVGGLCAFLGAVLLVSAGWGVVGELGRVAMLAALTVVSLGAGQLASSRGLATGAAVARALAGLFGTVATGYAFYLLNESGRLGLLAGLCALSLASGALASSRGAPQAGLALLALGSQLGWAVGAQAIHMGHGGDRRGVLSAVAAVVSVLTYALALHRRSFLLGVLGALDLAMFLGFFGVWLDRGTAMGLAMYALAGSALYLLFARAATSKADSTPAVPYAGGVIVCAAVSALAGLHVMSDRWVTHGVAGAAWPYAVALAALAGSLLAGPGGGAARFVALATLTLAPIVESLVRDELGFTLAALVLGLVMLLAAALAPSLRERGEARTELMFLGLVGALGAPAMRALHALDRAGREGDTRSQGAWITLAAGALTLLLISYVLTGRVKRAQHRMLEVTGLGALFALLTLRVLTDTQDLFTAAVTLGGAAVATALGGFTRRAAVLAVGATALGVNLWVQYFVRLAGMLPLSVRLVGFGVGLLLGGVIYEQTLRRRMAALKDWD
jgi:hypothetical protein